MITTMSTIYPFRTASFSNSIYMFGTKRFTTRDGYVGIPSEYYIPVQQYFAKTFSMENLNDALTNGWINQQEYDETLVYMPKTI